MSKPASRKHLLSISFWSLLFIFLLPLLSFANTTPLPAPTTTATPSSGPVAANGELPTSATATHPPFIFGIDQQVGLSFFSDPRFLALGPSSARLVIYWPTALQNNGLRYYVDQWYQQALAAHLQPLIAFNAFRERAPTLRKYQKAVKAAVKRWPLANFEALNEANHTSQPTWNRPALAAEYAKILDHECLNICQALPLSVLIYPGGIGLNKWLATWFRVYGKRPNIWAIHLYDFGYAKKQFRKFMDLYHPSQVWITETGGWNHFLKKFPPNLKRQTRQTALTFKPLQEYPQQITHVYYYQWLAPTFYKKDGWDSALISNHNKPRPAYFVLAHIITALRKEGF